MVSKKSEDRRIQKTRKALGEALISLMSEKRYESISIQEVLDRANIGRSTFYMHFRDKDALLVYGFQDLRELLRDAQTATVASPTKSYEKVIGFSLAMFEHVYEHKKLYKALVGGYGWDIVRQEMEETLIQLMKEEVRPFFKKRGSSEIPFELFVHFLGSTFISVTTWWLENRRPISPKEIDVLFRELVVPTLLDNLN